MSDYTDDCDILNRMGFIEIKDLRIEFTKIDEGGNEVPGKVALDGVTLDIEKGSFVAIAGMNGSGKSTLAKCLNGLLTPTAGTVVVDGFDTADYETIWDVRSRVGMVFQNPDNQLVSTIAEDDVAFGPENLGIDPAEIRERVDNALIRVGMFELKDKGAHMLSGGQKQRIAIAGAIAMMPDCIVFDEPTAMLDPKGRAGVMDIIKELHSEGITCILITHFMSEAEQAERVIVLKNGKVLCDRTPAALFSDKEMIERAGLEMPPEIELRDKAGLPEKLTTAEDIADYIQKCR
ncbi:MAG: energy-coupling factor transporter ATPase [Mogibacterium sp.]|nr:energy-coupling factor transporter ATPase [Mogibacterium sp.]